VLSEFGPEAVLSTGGYTSFPVALAARSRGIPIALYLPDVYPGWAVRAIARLASTIAVTAPESLRRLPDAKAVVTGYPVRDEFSQVNRPEARRRLGLDPEEKVLFVAGASQGAHSINQEVADNLRGLLELCEVLHISGPSDEGWLTGLAKELPGNLRARYHIHGYLHEEFPWTMAAADLALCRAGASVLGELPAVGLPAVLVPYPYAGAHQRLNARHLADNNAAVILDDGDLGSMLPLVGGLLHDSAQLDAMSQASRRLARPEAARNIARLILDLSTSSEPAGP
jgi:UDP-N-acetylglucosamine--N-acetylmuramyl-(pentapeptide) pyrophosphoryl-undecaprenol N-acetylglucosamine transferase